MTRQEVAWALASQWTPKTSESDEEGAAEARKARTSSARRADVADFAAGGARPEDAEQAWNDVDELRREWAASVSAFARLRYALSLKSLRWRRRARRQADAARKDGRSLAKRMGRRKGKR